MRGVAILAGPFSQGTENVGDVPRASCADFCPHLPVCSQHVRCRSDYKTAPPLLLDRRLPSHVSVSLPRSSEVSWISIRRTRLTGADTDWRFLMPTTAAIEAIQQAVDASYK